MYALKVLSGLHAGKTFPIQSSVTHIGRSPDCEIHIPNKNISKKHAKIIADSKRLVFTDLNSTNGSFVNGVKVEVTLINIGDKIVLFDTLLEVIKQDHFIGLSGNTDSSPESIESDLNYNTPVDKNFGKIDAYLEKSAMAPFYILLEKMDFKFVIGLFALSLILSTALLSTIPLMNIIQESVEVESKNRARSLAKLIATTNREALMNGRFSAVSVALGFKEPGVNKAVIIRQSNGEIIAPQRMSGQFLKGPIEGKVHSYRKITDRPHHTFKANSDTIISMYPIKFYSSKDGLEVTQFYSVIVYNAKVLSLGSGQTLNLFVQTLLLALLFGLVIFYFLYKVIQHPFKQLKADMSDALSSGQSELKTKILFAPLQSIYIATSSLINRSSSDSGSTAPIEADRNIEVQNLINMIGYAAVIISANDEVILEYNPYFEELTNLYDLKGTRIADLSDQALQQNISDLIDRLRESPDAVTENEFEFSGVPYEIKAQGIYGSSQPAYFVCVFFPVEVE